MMCVSMQYSVLLVPVGGVQLLEGVALDLCNNICDACQYAIQCITGPCWGCRCWRMWHWIFFNKNVTFVMCVGIKSLL